MIPRLPTALVAIAALMAVPARSWAGPAASVSAPAAEQDGEGEAEGDDDEPTLDDTLSRYRTPFGVLLERTIGTTSRPVEFDWRRTTAHVAAMGNHLFELNNFNSLRAGGLLRAPTGGAIFELGVSYVWVWDTPSSELLAYTPYRQPGRPPRLEVDLTLGYPLAEGVVTVAPRFFPAVEMVFSAYAGLRYLWYPGSMKGKKFRERAAAIFSPAITDSELDVLDERRLDAMQVDTGRYGLMVGVGDDLYFRQGVFIAPRLMMAVPVMAPASGTELLFWADLSVTIGVAF